MRTMFISLVLIWSLAQLAWAAEEILASSLGCGVIGNFHWLCFAPESCIIGKAVNLFTDGAVDRLETTAKISADCEAVFRFHHYNARHVYVSIIGFQSLDKTNMITFSQSILDIGNNVKQLTNKFSCTIEDDGKEKKRKAGYFYKATQTEKNIEKEGKASNPSVYPFECEFVVRKRDNAFFAGRGPFVVIETNNGKTIETHKTFHLVMDGCDALKCDPANLEYDNTVIPEKKFVPVSFFPKKHGCEYPEIYTLEYRDTTGNFKKLSKDGLSCNGDTYQVNGVDFQEIDIRCSADVIYFCNYNVMRKEGQEFPSQTLPNLESKIMAKLTCPDDHPHLIIVKGEREDPILNFGGFTCKNYGTQQLWTVHDKRKNRDIKITEEGPVVYCSKTVKCSHFFTLPESAVHNGYVDNEFFPRCHDATGTLTADKKEVTKPRCDGKTGKFMYTVEGQEKEIDKNTKFVCTYPPENAEADKKNEENAQKLTNGIVTAIAVGLGTALIGIGGFSWYQIRKKKAFNKKMQSEIYAEQMAWGSRSMKEAAKKATEKGKDKKKGSKSSSKTESATDAEKNEPYIVIAAQNVLAAAVKPTATGELRVRKNARFSQLPEKAPTAPSLVRIIKKCALATGKKKDPNEEKKKIEDMTPFEVVYADSLKLYLPGIRPALVARDKKAHPEKHKQKKK